MQEPTAYYDMEAAEDDLLHHLKIKKGDVAKYVLLPGDPKRCGVIAKFLDNPKLIADYREYVTITGTYKGVPVSVCSTGIGGPSASIAVEELIVAGADTFIRVGTSGALRLDIKKDDVVVAQAAVRDEGTSHEYLPPEYPVCADYNVVCALQDAAEALKKTCHVGMVHSKDAFYAEVEPQNAFFSQHEENKLAWYTKCGVTASEMEAAAIFAAATMRKVRAGAVLQIVDTTMLSKFNTPMQAFTSTNIDTVIQIALEAVYTLAAKHDKETPNE